LKALFSQFDLRSLSSSQILDACRGVAPDSTQQMLKKLKDLGVTIVDSSAVLSGSIIFEHFVSLLCPVLNFSLWSSAQIPD
jgi:hypothetical protein